jgi:ribosome maturation factor RimP
VDDRKKFVGELVGLEDGEVVLTDREGVNHRIPLEMVARARLHVEF